MKKIIRIMFCLCCFISCDNNEPSNSVARNGKWEIVKVDSILIAIPSSNSDDGLKPFKLK